MFYKGQGSVTSVSDPSSLNHSPLPPIVLRASCISYLPEYPYGADASSAGLSNQL